MSLSYPYKSNLTEKKLMTKLSMKSNKQDIYSAYTQAIETIEQLQQSELKTAVLHSIAGAVSFVLYQLRGDTLGNTMKLIASAIVPTLVFLYVCGEWTATKTHKVWMQASNALVLEPVLN